MRLDRDKDGRIRLEFDSVEDEHGSQEVIDHKAGRYTTWIFLNEEVAEKLQSQLNMELFDRSLRKL